jgi:class 3 adenylate cyclase
MVCGLRLAWGDLRPDARKPATILFNDVAGSTRLGDSLEPEAVRRIMWRYYERASRICERHGGTVEKFIGDAVMAVFGVPTAQEDHALRAVRAAVELRKSLAELDDELDREWGIRLAARTGISSGEVVAGDPAGGQALVTGDAVNVAARLEQAAAPGEILIADATRRLVATAVVADPVEPLELKGKPEPVPAWRLAEVTSMSGQLERRLDVEMLGRDRELGLVLAEFERAARERTPRLVTVLGPAGIGKSRLAHELRGAVEDEASVVVGSCLPYGEGITYWPLAEVVRELGGDRPGAAMEKLLGDDPRAGLIADRIGQAIGISEGAGDTRDLGWAVRRLFEAAAGERPLVAVFDDLHWAEEPMLDLIEHVAAHASDAPILLLCLAREELIEQRPGWPRDSGFASAIALEPLADDDVRALIEQAVDRRALEESMRDELVERAEGNPLFVEQMLALVREQPASGGRIPIPPTIQALLAARLDRLPLVELAALGAAAVVGPEFWPAAVSVLTDTDERDAADALLRELVRRELVRPEGSGLGGESGYSFRHGLIREAAYESLTKERRAGLHELYASWVEDRYPQRVAELEAILGYHLEQAYRYRFELSPRDRRAPALARRAADKLASAGRRAARGREDSAAAGLLSRARALLPADSGERLDLLPLIGQSLEGTANHSQAEEVYAEALEGALAAGDRGVEGRARLGRAHAWFVAKPDVSAERIIAEAERAIDLLTGSDEEVALAEAWRLIGDARAYEGRARDGEEALAQALAHLGPDASPRSWNAISFSMGMCLLDGPTPLGRALEFARDRLRLARDRGSRSMEADMLHLLGIGEGRRGRFDEGRQALNDATAISVELGLSYMAQWSRRSLGRLELGAGEPRAAERALRSSYELLSKMGLNSSLGEAAIPLADALCRQGRHDEASAFLEKVKEEWASGDVSIEAPRLAVRAKLLAAGGWHQHAARAAARALRLARRTDWTCLQVDVLLAHADVSRLAGSDDEAAAMLRESAMLADTKGYLAAVLEARRLLAELGEELAARAR